MLTFSPGDLVGVGSGSPLRKIARDVSRLLADLHQCPDQNSRRHHPQMTQMDADKKYQ
jgi:hypothetical protein